jgi:hypothetical protein
MGFLMGIFVATVGFDGVIRTLDNGVERIQDAGKDISQ